MAHPQQETVSRLLEALCAGDGEALDALFPLVYDELHALAQQNRRRWHGDYTMNTTALVHEAYLKLADQTRADWTSRAHFFAVAARAMRHILINYAQRRRTRKRGGGVPKLSLEEDRALAEDLALMSDAHADKLVALGEALKRLEQKNERQARVVECRFFGGMTIEETAEALGRSPATVKRDWAMAQAWLHRETQQELARWTDDTSSV